ncbi:fructose-1,6-bisphosphatase-3 [Clostridium collagenovorans DSM 3089]|uniref:Fructose-1,6-bisphosphatase class 3 n=1 Tax=Clostridium collagenovorans DSM 3089 TaxID=1121306 RepID=A0A1M5WL90_9CLOT|nr:fructose-1,6-bisphosphatase [Clostridium collagenovorans]SHH87904.1 fructose-1,6-bisphosphatase-3 [Clostridium collagenovorans DSM 3089]
MDEININILEDNLKYLELLSYRHPNIASACTEIINLQAILNLPKGTEHFLTDIHGEYESFTHVLKNASGVIKRKINDIFGNSLRESEKATLATLIYYPEEKLQLIKTTETDMNDWYKITIYQLIDICKNVSSKYTRSKVRKALPKDFSYIIEELLHEQSKLDKQEYYTEIVKTLIDIDRADEFIIAICALIQRLVVDQLHIIGDIYDRGPGAHIILDSLMNHHSVDIQWGNHDILWMGAAAGSQVCVAGVIRISGRYGNLKTIEEGYGINLLPLATFALEVYKDDPCTQFFPKICAESTCRDKDLTLLSKMHKAIAIIQFKLEGQTIQRSYPDKMANRLLLDKIDYEKGTISIDGVTYDLLDKNFPTIDPKDPYKLTEDENELIKKLTSYFMNCEKLQKHVSFLFSKGSLYLAFNSNLLYHACVPLDEDGNFKKVKIQNKYYWGKSLLDKFDRLARDAYFQKCKNTDEYNKLCLDFMWYLWSGEFSPLFGKNKMTTFERYFIKDKSSWTETKNKYFTLRDNEDTCIEILKEFGLSPKDSHIINGHVPVKTIKGESPIKANGKLLVIDGGFSKAYQSETGLAGYTLIYNSFGLTLVAHEPFESIQKAILEEVDILSSTIVLEKNFTRKRVYDTDRGLELEQQIEDLKMLLCAYRSGLIKERS